MNDNAITDAQTVIGLVASILLSVLAVEVAVNNSLFSIVFGILAALVSFISVQRAEEIKKSG